MHIHKCTQRLNFTTLNYKGEHSVEIQHKGHTEKIISMLAPGEALTLGPLL